MALAPLATRGSLRAAEQATAIVSLFALLPTLIGVAALLPLAVALLGACVVVASAYGDLANVGVALSAGALVLVAECASAADDLGGVATVERRLLRRLAARLALQAGAAAAVSGVVLASASLGVRADLATVLVGLVAAVSLIGLAAWLVTLRGRPGTRGGRAPARVEPAPGAAPRE